MAYYMVEVTHGASSRSDMYGATLLAQLFQQASLPSRETNVGGWVSARPRVTRTGGLLTSIHDNAFTTTAADLYEVPDDNSAARTVAILQAVRDRIALGITRIQPAVGVWSDVTVVRWAEPVNGAVDWWRGGFAARTTTEEQPPTLSTDADENPRGPTGADTHPTTPAETLEHMADQLRAAAQTGTSLLWAAAALTSVALLGYGVYTIGGYRSVAEMLRRKPAATPTDARPGVPTNRTTRPATAQPART